MKAFGRIAMLLGLLSLAGLTVLAIAGAFMGAERATEFFNSRPLTVFWAAFAAVLIIGVIASRNVGRSGGLLAMHVGCVLVIAGAMWGSSEAHRLREARYNEKKLTRGDMMLDEGRRTELAQAEGGEPYLLGFQVGLDGFRVEYYPPSDERWVIGAVVYSADEQSGYRAEQINWRLGEPVKIPFTDIELTVAGQHGFQRPQFSLARGEKVVTPIPKTRADEENFPLTLLYDSEQQWRDMGSPTLILRKPHQDIRDEIASLVIVENNRVIERAEVRPNHPMHYGGYHFYLAGYTPGEPARIHLKVVSDSGLIPVYIGFAMICLGAFWQFWIRPIYRARAAND